MISRCSIFALLFIILAFPVHAKEAFKYKSGTVVYSSKALICSHPSALDEGMAILRLGAEKAFDEFGECYLLDHKMKAVVIENVGRYVKVMLSMPDGGAIPGWVYNGYFVSEKDAAWIECNDGKSPADASCFHLHDSESLEE